MKQIRTIMLKIKLMKSISRNIFSGFGNTVFNLLTIKEIFLAKMLLVKQIEQGDEVFIPFQLNLKNQSIYY